ncbi:MAG: glycosyltransferase family 39 protein [Candidatus Moraniibacteriota bacterium]
MDFLKKRAYLIVAGILSFHFILSLVISSQESMVYDERAHIPAAYSYVRFGDMRLNPEHPPLLKDLAGLPLLMMHLSFPLQSDEWRSGTNEQWTIGDMFVNCTRPEIGCNDADAILFWARLPITLIAVILGIALFLWTKELGGTLAGLLAVTLYAFDPNIIAHNHYVTTDIGIAAFLFFAFYFFVRFLKHPNFKNVIVAGIFLGLAELAKFSAVLLFPVFGLFVLLYAFTKQKAVDDPRSPAVFRWHAIFAYGFKYLSIILVCFVLIWVLYFFNTINMPGEKLITLADHSLSQNNLPARFAHTLVVTTSQSIFLKPLSEYFLGVAMVFARVTGGNNYYYLGTVSNQAVASYFPVVFVLKETLVFLFLLLATTVYTLARIGKSLVAATTLWDLFARSFQNKITQYLSVFFILFYGYVSITGNLTIGFRHLFPILPFLYMLVAKTIFDCFKHHADDTTTKKMLAFLLGGLTLSIMAIPVLAYPHYLSYFNVASGGHLNGYKYVTDSNYDWGQDLKRLRNFVESHNRCAAGIAAPEDDCSIAAGYPSIDKIRVDYFGGSSPSYYLGDTYVPWHSFNDPEPDWYALLDMLNRCRAGTDSPRDTCALANTYPDIGKIRTDYFNGANPQYYLGNKYISWHSYNATEPGWYALSIGGVIQESSFARYLKPGDPTYDWLTQMTPVTRAGDSIFIYYIPEKR